MQADILICGGGIIGLTIARGLLKNGFSNIVLLEKESFVGFHASGRNSGVLHAGIYYSPDSLKAKFCLRGNLLMKQYCREKNLFISEKGKVIVTKSDEEIHILKELFNTAQQNGAKTELIDEAQLREIEPFAITNKIALYSYDTAVINPSEIIKSLSNDLISSGKVKILTNTLFKGLKKENIAKVNNNEEIQFDYFINAGGAYSDRIANFFGVGKNYKMIPFKGTYKKLKNEKAYLVKSNIYPVPDLQMPFLGVHFTRNYKGEVYAGPTATPALGRENYGIFKGMDEEVFSILYRDIRLFFENPQFKANALGEMKKYWSANFFEESKKLIKNINPEDFEFCEKAGIRPQLVDWQTKKLVMDYKIIREGKSIHILNSISPAFTSSMSFAEYIVNTYLEN